VLILLRTALLALFRLNDAYLLSNCIAGLQSLAAVAEDLDHYCSERLVTVLIRLAKKYLRGAVRTGSDGTYSASLQERLKSITLFDTNTRADAVTII